MEIKIDAEPVNAAIAEAIINSAIGEQLKAAITKEMDKLSRSYDNPIEKVVEEEILKIIRLTISSEHIEAIKTAVSAKVTDAVVDDVFSAAWDSFMKKL